MAAGKLGTTMTGRVIGANGTSDAAVARPVTASRNGSRMPGSSGHDLPREIRDRQLHRRRKRRLPDGRGMRAVAAADAAGRQAKRQARSKHDHDHGQPSPGCCSSRGAFGFRHSPALVPLRCGTVDVGWLSRVRRLARDFRRRGQDLAGRLRCRSPVADALPGVSSLNVAPSGWRSQGRFGFAEFAGRFRGDGRGSHLGVTWRLGGRRRLGSGGRGCRRARRQARCGRHRPASWASPRCLRFPRRPKRHQGQGLPWWRVRARRSRASHPRSADRSYRHRHQARGQQAPGRHRYQPRAAPMPSGLQPRRCAHAKPRRHHPSRHHSSSLIDAQ